MRDPLIREFRHAVLAGCSDVPRIPGPRSSTAQHPGRDLLEFCRDRPGDVTRFCYDTRVWPTNNISERDLRPAKTQQKISGRLTSEDITQDRLDIRSYIDTASRPVLVNTGVTGSRAVDEVVVVIGHLRGRAETCGLGPTKVPATMIHLTVRPGRVITQRHRSYPKRCSALTK